MNIYKINIELKQITPMLHFQGNETEATLRATELKPKLDRFILAWIAYENNNITWDQKALDVENQMFKNCLKELTKTYKNWFIDPKSEKIALNYKVRIIPGTPKTMNVFVQVPKNNKNNSSMVTEYYGNAGYVLRQKDNKFQSKYHETITILIKCFDQDLNNKIIELFPLFMDTTAFGFQQGKGYGNFTINKINDLKLNPSCKENMVKVVNHFNSKDEKNLLLYELDYTSMTYDKSYDDYINNHGGLGTALDAIAQYNHILKSGLNLKNTGVYLESILLKKYFKEGQRKQLLNEKKVMKAYLESNGVRLKNYYHESENLKDTQLNDAKYMRGFFGFAQEYVFLDNDNHRNSVSLKATYRNGRDNVEISRVPSPLSYHIDYFVGNDGYNDCKIYILVDLSIVKRLKKLNPDIFFKYKNSRNGFKAKMAPFDMEDFFEYALKQQVSFKEKDRKISTVPTEKSYKLKRIEGVK